MISYVIRRVFAFVKTRKEARRDYSNFVLFYKTVGIAALISGIFYPPLALAFSVSAVLFFYLKIYSEYLTKEQYYKLIMKPLMTSDHYFQIGYEVPEDEDELNRHVEILKKPKKEKIKELAAAARRALREPWRIVGLSKDVLTRHFWVIGATGAGKTSLLMNMFKSVFKLGAGTIYNDGKSDVKMFMKLYSLAEQESRETDVLCVNFLKPEKTKFDTNTFSPLATLPASGQIEFIASLSDTGGGGGNMEYWQGRGKALLAPVVHALYFRKQFYGENYSYETIANALSSVEFSFLTTILNVMARQFNAVMESDVRLQKLIKEAFRVVIPKTKVPVLEAITAYMIQYPYRAAELEKLGYNRAFVESLFRSYSSAFEIYLKTLSAEWPATVETVSELFLDHLKGRSIDPLQAPITTLRKEYVAFIEKLKRINADLATSYLNPPERDVTQHNYAQQQWTNIFTTFESYSHIFGSLDPDVDMIDVIRNNKILYVLLPSLEQDAAGRSILGKTIVIAIKSAAAVALGGEIEGLTDTQQKIISSIITPIPLGLVVLDEYGAYPVPEIDTIAAQVRSINISFWLATQDYTSARVGGRDENSVNRVWANTSKVVMKLEDTETKMKLRENIVRNLVASPSKATKFTGTDVGLDYDLSVSEADIFDPKVTSRFADGFSMFVVDGRPAYVQVFWADQKPIERITLNRFEPV